MYCSVYESVSFSPPSMFLARFLLGTLNQHQVDIILSELIWNTAGITTLFPHGLPFYQHNETLIQTNTYSGCYVLSFIYTRNDLVTHALVWLGTVQLSA